MERSLRVCFCWVPTGAVHTKRDMYSTVGRLVWQGTVRQGKVGIGREQNMACNARDCGWYCKILLR